MLRSLFQFRYLKPDLKFWHNTSLKLHRKVTKIFANLGNGLHFKVYSVFGQNLRNDTQEGICDRCMSFCPTNFKKRKTSCCVSLGWQLPVQSTSSASCEGEHGYEKPDVRPIKKSIKDYVSYAYLDILSVQTSLSAVPRFHLSRNGVFADSDIISKPIMQ